MICLKPAGALCDGGHRARSVRTGRIARPNYAGLVARDAQNLTEGGVPIALCSGWSSSKKSLGCIPIDPAISTNGSIWIALLYWATELLKELRAVAPIGPAPLSEATSHGAASTPNSVGLRSTVRLGLVGRHAAFPRPQATHREIDERTRPGDEQKSVQGFYARDEPEVIAGDDISEAERRVRHAGEIQKIKGVSDRQTAEPAGKPRRTE